MENFKIKKEDILEIVRNKYFNNLGLNLEFLKNKKILDIGAGQANFAKSMSREGIEVVSQDVERGGWGHGGNLNVDEGLLYIVGEATNLPLADDSLDLVLSSASVPTISKTKKEVVETISEIKRVLKPGGEFRFGPGSLNTSIFEAKELFTKEEANNFTHEQRVGRIKEKSIDFLKEVDENISISNMVRNDGSKDIFFIYKKPLDDKKK